MRRALCERSRKAARAHQRRRRACRRRLRQRDCCLVTHWSAAFAPLPGAKRAHGGACGRVWQALQELRGGHCRTRAVTRCHARAHAHEAHACPIICAAPRTLSGPIAHQRLAGSPHKSHARPNKAAAGALTCDSVWRHDLAYGWQCWRSPTLSVAHTFLQAATSCTNSAESARNPHPRGVSAPCRALPRESLLKNPGQLLDQQELHSSRVLAPFTAVRLDCCQHSRNLKGKCSQAATDRPQRASTASNLTQATCSELVHHARGHANQARRNALTPPSGPVVSSPSTPGPLQTAGSLPSDVLEAASCCVTMPQEKQAPESTAAS